MFLLCGVVFPSRRGSAHDHFMPLLLSTDTGSILLKRLLMTLFVEAEGSILCCKGCTRKTSVVFVYNEAIFRNENDLAKTLLSE